MCWLAAGDKFSPSQYCICLMEPLKRLRSSSCLSENPHHKYPSSFYLSHQYNVYKIYLNASPLSAPSQASHTLPPFERSSVFTSCFLSTPHTSPPPLSLWLSCWKWLSVYFYPLVLSNVSLFHPFFPLFLTSPALLFSILFFFSFTFPPCPCECCIRTFLILSWRRHICMMKRWKIFEELFIGENCTTCLVALGCVSESKRVASPENGYMYFKFLFRMIWISNL